MIAEHGIMLEGHESLARVYTAVGLLILEIPSVELLSSAGEELRSVRDRLAAQSPETAIELDSLLESMSLPLGDIKADYATLFAGVRRLPAPPWESCYLSGKRQVCTEVTERVRQAYLAACLYQGSSDTQPDDHIGLELQFLGAMSKRITDALEVGDAALADVTAAQRADFITEHLSRWVSAFCADLEQAAGTEFYRSLARLTAGLANYEVESMTTC